MLPDLLADAGEGHRIVSTVFIECRSFYRSGGPRAMRPVGETEFVNGAAAMSHRGAYGPTRACAGIVGHPDLSTGPAFATVIAAPVAPRTRRTPAPRHPASWAAAEELPNMQYAPPPNTT